MYRKLNSVHLARLGGQFFSLGLFQFGHVGHRLWTQDVASPVAVDLIISVVIGPDSFHQLRESSSAFQVNLFKGDNGAGLPVE